MSNPSLAIAGGFLGAMDVLLGIVVFDVLVFGVLVFGVLVFDVLVFGVLVFALSLANLSVLDILELFVNPSVYAKSLLLKNIIINKITTTPKILCIEAIITKSVINTILPKIVFKKKLKILDWLNRMTRIREIAIPVLYLLNGIKFII
jgi:hypothetical protein